MTVINPKHQKVNIKIILAPAIQGRMYVYTPHVPETLLCRKTDCLVVGELYRVKTFSPFPPWNADLKTNLYKRPSMLTKNSNVIGSVKNNQIVTYLGESVFELDYEDEYIRMDDKHWFYKVFADDQVGYVYGPDMRLNFLKTEEIL